MESSDAAAGFSALSQETRLNLMRILATKGASGMAAGELASALGQVPSTLSFHLAALEQSGLVQSTRQGRNIIYAVRFAGLRALFSFLTETCCGGRPDLCGDLARLLPEDQPEVHMTPAFNVLFLCTHNSARSLMAEAILEQVGKGKFNAYSAGSEPARAADAGGARQASGARSRRRAVAQQVVGRVHRTRTRRAWISSSRFATCCRASSAPTSASRPVTGAWPLPDPAKFMGSDVERATMINELYGMIRRRLEIFVNLPYASLDRMALKKRLDEIGDSAKAPA